MTGLLSSFTSWILTRYYNNSLLHSALSAFQKLLSTVLTVWLIGFWPEIKYTCPANTYYINPSILSRYSRSVEHTKASVLAVLTLALALTTLLPTIIQNLYLAYVCDAAFNIITSSCMTIALFKIAHSLTTNLYGFVVGVNACVAGTLDLLVTFIVIDERVLSFNPRQQYWVYTGFAVVCVLGLFWLQVCHFAARRW